VRRLQRRCPESRDHLTSTDYGHTVVGRVEQKMKPLAQVHAAD
jgi:hypothetical protein